jgi:hypothetical protein
MPGLTRSYTAGARPSSSARRCRARRGRAGFRFRDKALKPGDLVFSVFGRTAASRYAGVFKRQIEPMERLSRLLGAVFDHRRRRRAPIGVAPHPQSRQSQVPWMIWLLAEGKPTVQWMPAERPAPWRKCRRAHIDARNPLAQRRFDARCWPTADAARAWVELEIAIDGWATHRLVRPVGSPPARVL